LSKLPGDVIKRKAAAEEVTCTLDCDLKEKKLSEQIVPYSDKLFLRAAVEWLVATDQVRICPYDQFFCFMVFLHSQSEPLNILSSRR
jgi:hypothetical protein